MEERIEFGGCDDGGNPMVLGVDLSHHGSDHFVFGAVFVSTTVNGNGVCMRYNLLERVESL
jgi:hypothetical protein